jgi:hypothetical protein
MATVKRLIDAKALFNDLADYWGIPKDWDGRIEQTCEDALCAIENAPEVDAVEVVHGRWRLETDIEEPNPMFKLVVCCVCGKTASDMGNYCPNCGAKMDGDGNG